MSEPKTVEGRFLITFLMQNQSAGCDIIQRGREDCKHENCSTFGTTLSTATGRGETHTVLCSDCGFIAKVATENKELADAFLRWYEKQPRSQNS